MEIAVLICHAVKIASVAKNKLKFRGYLKNQQISILTFNKRWLQIINMDLTIEGTALTFFWGTFIANFVWANRYTVYTKSKSYAKNVAAFVLAKSKQAFRRIREEKKLEAESEQNQQAAGKPQLAQSQLSIEENCQQPSEVKNSAVKLSKSIKKQRNIRRYKRNYEQCIMRRAYSKKLEENENKYLRQLHNNLQNIKKTDEIELMKKESVQNMEDFQKFMENQLDIEEDVSRILPYDPFENQVEQEGQEEENAEQDE